MTVARAPGKVILLGEHAVVYGHPALAASITRSVRVELRRGSAPALELPGGLPTPAELLEAAVQIARGAGLEGAFHARVESDIPLGSGLGSSAALGVALARACAKESGRPCAPELQEQLALVLERVLHGKPSGIDPAACVRANPILFTRGDPPRVEEVLPARPTFVAVALTGVLRGTRSTVLPLSERRQKDPERVEPLLARLGELARGGRGELERGDLAALGGRFDEAHAILRELGVSCPELDDVVGRLRRAGALGAKLTGAGGGGAAIALAKDEEHARALAAQLGAGAFATRLGSGS